MTKLAFANGLVLAVQTIRSHKMRAFLTVLGVIIGTGTIIGVAAILTGFDANMTAVLRSFGPNSIIVFKFPVGFRVNNLSPEERTRKNLTYENAVHLRERCQQRGGRLRHAVPFQRHGERQVHGQRHVRRQPLRRGGRLRDAAAGRWISTWAVSSPMKRATGACPWP